MKFDIIIQARYQSTRLPGKILLNFDGTNFLEFLIKNLKRIKSINRIIIITPKDEYLKIFSEISIAWMFDFGYILANFFVNIPVPEPISNTCCGEVNVFR